MNRYLPKRWRVVHLKIRREEGSLCGAKTRDTILLDEVRSRRWVCAECYAAASEHTTELIDELTKRLDSIMMISHPNYEVVAMLDRKDGSIGGLVSIAKKGERDGSGST